MYYFDKELFYPPEKAETEMTHHLSGTENHKDCGDGGIAGLFPFHS